MTKREQVIEWLKAEARVPSWATEHAATAQAALALIADLTAEVEARPCQDLP